MEVPEFHEGQGCGEDLPVTIRRRYAKLYETSPYHLGKILGWERHGKKILVRFRDRIDGFVKGNFGCWKAGL